MWLKLVELQPQTAGDSGGISREEFIAKIASDIQTKLPPLFDVDRVRKNIGEITPTTVVLLQELDRFNVLIKKMSTSLINLQRVRGLYYSTTGNPNPNFWHNTVDSSFRMTVEKALPCLSVLIHKPSPLTKQNAQKRHRLKKKYHGLFITLLTYKASMSS